MEKVVKCWNREVVESPFVEVYKSPVKVALRCGLVMGLSRTC